jgi:hypothetical protein
VGHSTASEITDTRRQADEMVHVLPKQSVAVGCHSNRFPPDHDASHHRPRDNGKKGAVEA